MAAKLRSIGLCLTICVFLQSLCTNGHSHISRVCLDCKHISDPASCTTHTTCGNELCKTDVHFLNGSYSFSFGCNSLHEADCPEVHVPISSIHVIGKRGRHSHEEGQLVCHECCSAGTSCNKDGCSNYRLVPTTTTTTTTRTTTTPKPVNYDPDCHDTESESFKCAELTKFNFCTDPSSLAHTLAYEKCPLFCGFCHPSWETTRAPLTTVKPMVTDAAGLCSDNEVQGFSCVEWKGFGFCSSTSGSGYSIAKERCQKTCGFCN
ncbi:uncharacterized protein LOC132730534 [Ruditapes philippinarum]|uniref:uncharacterized protein LOC132730534 n=1 Tax=Ruditapes philippinarum TaxID=129788 RepID=UPI00295BC8D4|nr:uncharacterized protein LOC132730534 [Ruditapes philippinarum]